MIRAGADPFQSGRPHLGAILLAAQIAFSLCSLSGAALLPRTLSNLRDAPRDFALDGVVTFSLAPIADSYNGRDLTRYYRQLLTEVGAIPGVEVATLADNTPMGSWPSPFDVEAASPSAANGVTATSGCVSPELFPVLNTPLLVGRPFDAGDRVGAQEVAIVNQPLARNLFGNASPIGEQIRFGNENSNPDRRVIGVVQDRGFGGARQFDVSAVYVPCAQRGRVWAEGYLTLVVKADGPGSGIIGPVTERIGALAVELPVRTTMLRMRAEQALVSERALTTVSGAIAVIALVLAGIGVLSVASCRVCNEKRAIGVRISIGGNRMRVLSWALPRMVWVPQTGVGAGLPLALFTSRFLKSVLFGIPSREPLDSSWSRNGPGPHFATSQLASRTAGLANPANERAPRRQAHETLATRVSRNFSAHPGPDSQALVTGLSQGTLEPASPLP